MDLAFPLWAHHGFDERTRLFRESLTSDLKPGPGLHRLRVQSRQTFVFVQAGAMGWDGPWMDRVRAGLEVLMRTARTDYGAIGYRIDSEGALCDDRWDLYDQAFGLFALANARALDPTGVDIRIGEIITFLKSQKGQKGGFLEGTVKPFPRQQNPHMHLLEAGFALRDAGLAVGSDLISEIKGLLQERFFNPRYGALPEYFDDGLVPLDGDQGLITEPGHHCEWAWLLSRLQADGWTQAKAIGEALWDHALRYGRRQGVLVDEVYFDGQVRLDTARLWPQSEWLKAALVRYEQDKTIEARNMALMAFEGLYRYLDVEPLGLWHDRLAGNGQFLPQPAPATSFYHILIAMSELRRIAAMER